MDKRAGRTGRIRSGRIVLALPVIPSRRCFKGKRKGGGQIVPPFEGLGQRGIAAAQLLQVIGGCRRVRQRANNVGENKPPLLIVKDPAHQTFFEKGHLAHLKTFPLLCKAQSGPPYAYANRFLLSCVVAGLLLAVLMHRGSRNALQMRSVYRITAAFYGLRYHR